MLNIQVDPPQELLSVEGLSKRFGSRQVLQGVNFSIRAGEILGLIGPNGSGKTTLLEVMAGLMPDNGGTVRFNSNSLQPAKRKDKLFYLPDGINPWEEQTVGWALKFFEQIYPRSSMRIGSLIAPLNLTSLMTSHIGSLSKGERKRFLLGLGLMTPHELLLLDEPFDGLDLKQTRDVMTLLRKRSPETRALLLSIHQLTDAERVCDRLVLLSDGRVVGEGTLSELRKRAGLPDGGLEEIFLALT